ncbi:NUDIX hydrolase [Paracoccaceae bacterium]|nr:NUDIX hydrolase [Paracoccaceae bacterium]
MPGNPISAGSNLSPKVVTSYANRTVYNGFFSVKEYDLSFTKFDGSKSELVTRSALISFDAVIVLPYDPVHDRVLLVEQFRAGLFARQEENPWCLEPIAGLIDQGETPEEAGLREADEEAGLTLSSLELVARSYPSPGISTEFFHQYIGITSLPETTSLVSGLASEAEDIRSHIFCFSDFLKMIEAGQITVGPAILLGLWLARHRDKLRAAV